MLKISLKAARINKGLKQKEAAKLIGVSQTTLSSWECGKTIPNCSKIDRIVVTYGVPFDCLIFHSRKPTKSDCKGVQP